MSQREQKSIIKEALAISFREFSFRMSSENLLLFSWRNVKINEFYEIIVCTAIIWDGNGSRHFICSLWICEKWQDSHKKFRAIAFFCCCWLASIYLEDEKDALPENHVIFIGRAMHSNILSDFCFSLVHNEESTAALFITSDTDFSHSFGSSWPTWSQNGYGFWSSLKPSTKLCVKHSKGTAWHCQWMNVKTGI